MTEAFVVEWVMQEKHSHGVGSYLASHHINNPYS